MTPDDPRHGTNAGYAAHIYHGTRPCLPCREAHNAAGRQWHYARHRGDVLAMPTVGVHRRIRALQRLGWTLRDIARAGGWADNCNVQAVLRSETCRRATWVRIVRAYDKLSMTLPPDTNWSARTRRHAERNGWLPPLAWDDDKIDDPAHNPQIPVHSTNGFNIDEAVVLRVLAGEHVPTNRAEREEITRRWLAKGGSQATLCARMGWKQGRYAQAPVDESHGVVGKPGNDESSAQRKAS